MNPRLFDDVSFHPCVRFKRWESERMLSFVPPDGNFRLMSYHIGTQSVVAIPIYVRHNLSFKTGEQGKLDITVGPKTTLGRTVESVKLEIFMPKNVLNCLLVPNQGKYSFDPVQKILHWDVGRVDVAKLPNLRGTVSYTPIFFLYFNGIFNVLFFYFSGFGGSRQCYFRNESFNQCAIQHFPNGRVWLEGE